MFGFWRPLLQRLALAAQMLSAASAAASLSGTVEIDLIFPQNATYAPTTMMPVVWAVQDANLAAAVDGRLEVAVMSSIHGRARMNSWLLPLTPANLTGKEIYYAYTYSTLFTEEDSFSIAWSLSYTNHNCSTPVRYNDEGQDFGGVVRTYLTTKNGSQPVDLQAARAANCSEANNLSFNVTGTTSKNGGSSNSTEDQCAFLSPRRPVLNWGTPCDANPDAAAVSSITASLAAAFTSSLCDGVKEPTGICAKENAARELWAESRNAKNKAVLVFLAIVAVVACM
ncbi:hypothetical protein PWT90_03748 [Aphanocladium album]|nr:hypothetical protein PWT90_03748 [Aphanocladium album]